ncbi:CAMK/MLCK protein kinase [Aphelenchoides avenae]|nr:CAMK/MLCK protein kinase [Aphelenchus avenae]
MSDADGSSTYSADAIKVDEQNHFHEEWTPPFNPREGVHIKTKEKFTDYYDLFEEIGEGKFGKVFRCVEKSTQLTLAAKCIKLKRDADIQKVEKEVNIMTQMKHKCIAQIYDAFASKDTVILIMEIVEGGELFERVVDESYILTEMAVASIIYQLCEAIRYIHSQKIIHLDLKPENIMCVTQTGNQIKLIDFGLAQYYDGSGDLLFMAGTPEFAAPEVIKYEPLDFHTDMWSVGVITYILLSGQSPFLGENVAVTYCNVEKGKWEFCEEFDENAISEEAKNFVTKLLVYDKRYDGSMSFLPTFLFSQRMLPEDCLQHPWIIRYREHARKVAMEQPAEEEKPLARDKLKTYVRCKRFRKMVYGVLFVNSIIRQLSMLQEQRSENGIRFVKDMLNAANQDQSANLIKNALFAKRRRDALEDEPVPSTSREPSGEELHTKAKRSNQMEVDGDQEVPEPAGAPVPPTVLKVPLSTDTSSRESSRASSPKATSPTRRKEERLKKKVEKVKRTKTAKSASSTEKTVTKKPKTDAKKSASSLKPPIPETSSASTSEPDIKKTSRVLCEAQPSTSEAKPLTTTKNQQLEKPPLESRTQTIVPGEKPRVRTQLSVTLEPVEVRTKVLGKVASMDQAATQNNAAKQQLVPRGSLPMAPNSREATASPSLPTIHARRTLSKEGSPALEAKPKKKVVKKVKASDGSASEVAQTTDSDAKEPKKLKAKLKAKKVDDNDEKKPQSEATVGSKPKSLVGSLLQKMEQNADSPPMLMHVASCVPIRPSTPQLNADALRSTSVEPSDATPKKKVITKIKKVEKVDDDTDASAHPGTSIALSLEKKVVNEKKTSMKKKIVKKETSHGDANGVESESLSSDTRQVKMKSTTLTKERAEGGDIQEDEGHGELGIHQRAHGDGEGRLEVSLERLVKLKKQRSVAATEKFAIAKAEESDDKKPLKGKLSLADSTTTEVTTTTKASKKGVLSRAAAFEENHERQVAVSINDETVSTTVKARKKAVLADKPPRAPSFGRDKAPEKTEMEKDLEFMRRRLRKQQTSVHEGRKSVRFSNDALDEAGRNHSRSPSAAGRSPSVGVTRVFKSEADLTVAQQSLDDLQIANAKKKVRRSLPFDEDFPNPDDEFDFNVLRAKLESRLLGNGNDIDEAPSKHAEYGAWVLPEQVARVKSKWQEMDKANPKPLNQP